MESRESRASQASGVALRAPRAGRGSGVKGRLRLRPSRPLPTLPADLCQRAIRKPRRIHETLPAAASGHIPLELTTPQRERDSSDAGTLFSPFWETPPRRCLRPAPLKGSPCTFSDSGFPSDSGKPGKHPDLFAFYFILFFYRLLPRRVESPHRGVFSPLPALLTLLRLVGVGWGRSKQNWTKQNWTKQTCQDGEVENRGNGGGRF